MVLIERQIPPSTWANYIITIENSKRELAEGSESGKQQTPCKSITLGIGLSINGQKQTLESFLWFCYSVETFKDPLCRI
jgi:hypothetical protein